MIYLFFLFIYLNGINPFYIKISAKKSTEVHTKKKKQKKQSNPLIRNIQKVKN